MPNTVNLAESDLGEIDSGDFIGGHLQFGRLFLSQKSYRLIPVENIFAKNNKISATSDSAEGAATSLAAERASKSAAPSPAHVASPRRVEREHSSTSNNWVVEAAASSFYAARQRYRRRRSSRNSNSGDNSDTASLSGDGPPVRRIVSKYSGRELQLDDEQCEQLADAFFQIPDKYYAFEQMFLRLFTRDDPEIALVFGMQGIPELELRRRTPFRTHVCKFQRFMTTVMDLLTKKSREEELIQIIRMVGRQHCNVKQLSFTASRWLSFKNALVSTFSKKETDKCYVGWTILIGFLIYEVKDAYLSHIRHLRSSSLPQVLETYRLDFRRKTQNANDPTAECSDSNDNIASEAATTVPDISRPEHPQ